MNNIIKFVMILGLGLAMSACGEKEEASVDERPIIKIGAMLPLTGNSQALGNAAKKALSKAFEDANQNTNNKLRYELILEDDQMNSQKAHTIINKFVSLDEVNAVITYFSIPARVVAPIAAERKIINFNCSLATDIYKSKYNFQNFITNKAEADGMVEFLQIKGVDDVSLLFQSFAGADDILKELLPGLKQANINYDVERFNFGERDFKTTLYKLKTSPSQAVLVYAFEPELDIITKEMKLQKFDKFVGFVDAIPMTANIELYEEMYNIGSAPMPQDLRIHLDLESDNPSYATYMYDIGTIIVDAYENVYNGQNIPNNETVADFILSKKQFNGRVGDYTIDGNGQFHSKVEITVVENGKLVPVKR